MRSFECQRRADLLNNLRALIRRCRIKAVFNTSRDHGIELRVRHTLPKSTAVYFRLRDAPPFPRGWLGQGLSRTLALSFPESEPFTARPERICKPAP
jgi:hypothetical protein